MYHYEAEVVGVYDGDTITVDVDLGFGVWARGQKIRLAGIDAPELKGETREAGKRSRDALLVLFAQSKNRITLRTVMDRKEKYGRWLGYVQLADDTATPVNDWMVLNGHAKPWQN